MGELKLSARAEDFIWASGVEDTFVPQTKPGMRALDEYALTGHYEHWREDLALARALGVGALRWGVPWYRVEYQPGEFDWGWTDEVIPYMVEELGITPIIDLMHYGCPFWLRHEFISPDYVRAVSAYAAAFARRYRRLVKWYTPLNEPLVNALWCGKRGSWPPYLRGDAGYIRVLLQLAQGIVATVETIKEIDPASVMVHVEAAGLSRAIRQDLEVLATVEQRRGFIAYDLITGRVTPDHALYGWLMQSGAPAETLAEIARRPLKLDVLGLNFYPQWSTQHLYVDAKGRLAYRLHEEDGAGFAAVIKDYYERYRVPVIITETSAFGADELRARWLKTSVEAVKRLRGERVPVVGYTWFPMFTMIDWRYRHSTAPVEHFHLDLGLYKLAGAQPVGRWSATPLVEQFRSYTEDPAASIGTLDPSALDPDVPALEEVFDSSSSLGYLPARADRGER